jgi:hypothetical protein
MGSPSLDYAPTAFPGGPGHFLALAAAGGHAARELKFLEGHAGLRALRDGAVSDPVTDADDHLGLLEAGARNGLPYGMRLVIIRKQSAQTWFL